MARSRAISLWLPVVAWAAVIFALSAIPSLSSGLGTWDYVLRKCAHVTEYAVLDALRRYRVDVDDLDGQLANWRTLLERFAEERAPVYLRPDADVSSALRRLHASGTRVGVFTGVPEELARVALSQL